MKPPRQVIVVGGGIIGLSIALELGLKGVQVLLIEKTSLGAESSTAAAGMLAPQLESKGPGALLSLALASRSLYPAWISRIESLSKTATGYRTCGMVRFGDSQKLAAIAKWQTALGLRCEFKDGQLHLPDEHQVDPKKLLPALASAAHQTRATVRHGTVTRIFAHGVEVEGEHLDADAIIVATGAWTPFVGGLQIDHRHVHPVKGQMIELALPVSPFQTTRVDDHIYLVSRGDGRVVCGATMERVGYDKRVTAEGVAFLLNRAVALCPELKDANLVTSWSGLRPGTQDDVPLIGKCPIDGVYFATGHFRNGILLAPVTAQLLTQLLFDETPQVNLDPFRVDRFSS